MDAIDKALYYAETGIEPERTNLREREPLEIFRAIDRLKESSPYYFLQFWANTKEFQRSKLTRANAVPKTDEKEKDIQIEFIENTGNTPIQEDL